MNCKYFMLIVVLFSSCFVNNSEIIKKKSGDKTAFDSQQIIDTFREVDSLLQIDNGKFWNHQLVGSILIIDPETRVFYANENDASNKFKEVKSLFTDTFPTEMNIANTALDWNNKRWSMIMLPLPEDKIARNNLVIHELFHRIQPEIGFANLQEYDNGHLDSYKGRVLLKFELEALKKALNSQDEKVQKKHLNNAFIFRKTRQSTVDIQNAENALEINEGLAEYTGLMLSGRDDRQKVSHLIESMEMFYQNPTFVRSFAYQTIPIYGYFLAKVRQNWQLEVSTETNLTSLFLQSFDLDTSSSQSYEQIAQENEYDYNRIIEEEGTREKARLAKITEYKQKFLLDPTLKLNFENMNISFDPRNITPLETYGTVYPNLRVTDNFGILTVEKGALISADWSGVIVSAPTEISEDIAKGMGWTLALNEGWKVEKTEDEFRLIKE